MKITAINSIDEGTHQAFLIDSVKDLPKGLLSDGERKYASSQLNQEKGNWVRINRYDYSIFLLSLKHNVVDALFKEKVRKSGATLCSVLNEEKCASIQISSLVYPSLGLQLAEGIALANYQFLVHFTKAKSMKNSLKKIEVQNVSNEEAQELGNLVSATCMSRDLVNEPVNHLNAEQLAQRAVELGKENGFKVEVLNQAKIEALKMGGLLAINKGSVDPPTFTIMEYKPEKAQNSKPIVLVGKGVVYDTGGLSLKPTSFMDTMKSDMGGAAAVIGAMTAISSNKLPYHVIGLVPATDNRPGGNAITPGDVVTMYNGKTVEILNTDAEGRMILADALAYAQKYDPALVIDLATLTGSAARAIGQWGIVCMGSADRKYFDLLQSSGDESHERCVEFPFWSDYDELLKSDIADLKNLGPAEGGAITAGKFLANFTDYDYIHLDIAGPAFLGAKDSYRPKGGTAVGVRLLYDFVKNFK